MTDPVGDDTVISRRGIADDTLISRRGIADDTAITARRAAPDDTAFPRRRPRRETDPASREVPPLIVAVPGPAGADGHRGDPSELRDGAGIDRARRRLAARRLALIAVAAASVVLLSAALLATLVPGL